MQENINYAYAWPSVRRQNRFTATGTDGDGYSVTVPTAPKNIKTMGGLVKWLHSQNAHKEAYEITKALKEMEQRTLVRNGIVS